MIALMLILIIIMKQDMAYSIIIYSLNIPTINNWRPTLEIKR